MKTEKRPAKVGERILITGAICYDDKFGYENGEVLTVKKVHYDHDGYVEEVEERETYSILIGEYEVIIEEDETNAETNEA